MDPQQAACNRCRSFSISFDAVMVFEPHQQPNALHESPEREPEQDDEHGLQGYVMASGISRPAARVMPAEE